jgi:hypothetical protein
MPPTVDNQTPSVITGGKITVGNSEGSPYLFQRNDFDIGTRQDLNLYATESVTLLPGFETNLLYLDQAFFNNPCSDPHSSSSCCTAANLIDVWYNYSSSNPVELINPIQDEFSASIVSCPPLGDGYHPPRHEYHEDSIPSIVTDFNFSLYPNPATSECNVKFSIPASADVTITLVDIMGRDVATLDHSWHSQGTSFVPFSTERYAPGVYTVRFSDGTNTSTQRLTISGR